jgi:hypothetical protein
VGTDCRPSVQAVWTLCPNTNGNGSLFIRHSCSSQLFVSGRVQGVPFVVVDAVKGKNMGEMQLHYGYSSALTPS